MILHTSFCLSTGSSATHDGSCLGEAADVLVSSTRSSALGSTLKAPPKLERVRVPQWERARPFVELRQAGKGLSPPCSIALL